MKIYVHYIQRASPGYTPREPVRLHNVARVSGNGVNRVTVQTLFSDEAIVHDHVDRVVIEPEREEF